MFYKDFQTVDVVPPRGKILILKGENFDDTKSFFTLLDPSPPVIEAETFCFKASVFYDDILNNSWRMTVGYIATGRVIATRPQKINRKTKKRKLQMEGGETD
jgi:hypothetical protein